MTNANERMNPESKHSSKRLKTKSSLSMCRSCCCGLIIGALLVSIALAVILMLWLYKKTAISSTTTTTTTTTATIFCIPSCLNGGTCLFNGICQCITDVWTGSNCQTPVRILWKFDDNLDDFYNNFPGTANNAPTYNSPGINGYGKCLYLNALHSQSVTVHSPPFLNMAYTSFSLTAWVKATTLSNKTKPYSDNAIFGQFENNTSDRSLHIIIRQQKTYLGFYNDDTEGNIILYPNNWYHLAYIYDYSTLTQYLYVNGILDVSKSPRNPYKGTTGNLTIGTNGVFYPNNFWDGCLDQITYFSRAKSAKEILREATLTIDYSFDDNNLLDNGPLGINGTGSNHTFASSCRINKCLSLLNNLSYVQVAGLVLLGTHDQSYSFALWIKPTVTTRGTIIHVSNTIASTGWCFSMLGFTNSGIISVQSWTGSFIDLTGPMAVANIWTHITITYSAVNGLRLWINGTQYGSSTGAFNYAAPNTPLFVTIGSPVNGQTCLSNKINIGQYLGYIDEFKLYSRELSSTDIIDLANP